MAFLTGMYNTKIDDKGRLSLPARLRNLLSAEQVVVLPGLDENHLMLMTPDYFEDQFAQPILSTPMAVLDVNKRKLVRRLISPAQYIDIDSSGRINIPLSMRDKYSLPNKGKALLIGAGTVVEIWNPDVFEKAEEEEETSISQLAQELYDEGDR